MFITMIMRYTSYHSHTKKYVISRLLLPYLDIRHCHVFYYHTGTRLLVSKTTNTQLSCLIFSPEYNHNKLGDSFCIILTHERGQKKKENLHPESYGYLTFAFG